MTLEQASIIGAVTAINLIVIKIKYELDRNQDATLDLIVLILLAVTFGETISGLQIATITSALISVYLFFFPPNKLLNKAKKAIEKYF